MTKLHILGVPTLVLLMLAPNTMAGPIPKSGRSWHLWQSEKARFSGKSDCIALYSGRGSYQSYLKPLVLFRDP